jgi:undecaprenyl-diphosphatase
MIELLQALVLGLVEGITEFLPVSSTGHLIVAGHLLGFEGDKANTFDVFIQLGAILAVVFLYRERFFRLLSIERTERRKFSAPGPILSGGFAGLNGIFLLGLTTLPALVFGFLAHSYIKKHLFNPTTVAIGLAAGGVAILLIERRLPKPKREGLDSLTAREALAVGFFQCLALWPGVSRSGSTILGGMAIGIERKTAAEYSFLAAVPVMFAATGYDLLKSLSFLSAADIPVFLVGFVVSFISAWVAIKFFIRLLATHTLKPFGWYRIAVAVVILVVMESF